MKNFQSAIYAGFWVRFLAFLLDMAILVFPAVVAVFLSDTREEINYDYYVARSVSYIFSPEITKSYILGHMVLLSLIYQVVCNSSKMQATVGKWVFQLKVVDDNGERISAERAIGRYFASYLSMFLFCIGYLMIVWGKNKKSLHDVMAGTAVIKVKRKPGSWL
jgi:uncharacterized RDD family membrane protein YckC